ncbi:MAG: glycosyltransferase [Saprospiraceae bacterium]|nr:glycosyltransferase [Saprospiraceae bacterium]
MKDKTIFTFIGRLLYDKGIREFVEAARQIKANRQDVAFWVVGELDTENPATVDKDELVQWVEEDVVYYHGFVKDVRNIIAGSDCIVLPSYREAIPRTITEGMSMSKPVITTDTAGCREAVDEGVNGYLVEIRNVLILKII